MTRQKHLKRRVRDRMQKTGESYSVARRHVIAKAPPATIEGPRRWHMPGNIPLTTALRVLLTAAGYRAPHTGEPISEALLFGISGGIGAGMFTFRYEAEDFSSFYVAGRHLWQDDLAYLKAACDRFGVRPGIKETAGRKAADENLRQAMTTGRPIIAWVDLAHLPHWAMPQWMSGGGYHVVTVYDVDDDTVTIGDMTDEPVTLSTKDMTTARARIKKQKNRLLWLEGDASGPDLATLIRAGLTACHEGLANARMKNFTLEAFQTWAERMHGSPGKESWEKLFPPGKHLLAGLKSIHDFIHFNTGGGLMRPIMAEFLHEASDLLSSSRLKHLARSYDALGDRWNRLADSALPDEIAPIREMKELSARRAELSMSDAAGAVDEIRALWNEIDAMTRAIANDFPLDAAACDVLRADLQQQIAAIYEAEVTAHRAIGELLGGGF